MLFVFLLFASLGMAMKPAPFQPVSHIDASTGMILESQPDSNKTQIKTSKGDVLWEFDDFIGRKKVYLSPDGQELMLLGNLYFGLIFSSHAEAKIVVVYKKGVKIAEYTFEEVFGLSIADAQKRFDIPKMGGGWFGFMRYVSISDVDWSTHRFVISFQDGEKRTFSFVR